MPALAPSSRGAVLLDCLASCRVRSPIERKNMKAESVIMNPVAKVLALSAKIGENKYKLQIFNMEMRSKMKEVACFPHLVRCCHTACRATSPREAGAALARACSMPGT